MSVLKLVLNILLAFLFVAAGILHFIKPEMYVRIMPRYLPWPLLLQYVAGAFEILFGVMILIPKYRRLGAWGLILLLLAVFPANIQMALHPDL
ncbi:MAG TPA: MauE/DoxX family redox-associated membrane protein, partial [Blastocatellia bacterium]|nr:MauE/DoxX family redox-associated membrane protein [Blastocatellia bacterium]